MIRDLWEDGLVGKLMVMLCLVVACAIHLAVWGAVESERSWSQYKVTHECHIVGRMSGDVITTIGPTTGGGVSVGIGMTPDKTGWQCNDGITYWR